MVKCIFLLITVTTKMRKNIPLYLRIALMKMRFMICCSKNRKRIGEIIEREVAEAVPEGELSQSDDQAGSMADHFH